MDAPPRSVPSSPIANRPVDGLQDTIPVVLYEDGEGRLVVTDSRRPEASNGLEGQMLRIGRARLALRHLAPAVTQRLLDAGLVQVDGADALNVLLAFAHEAGAPPAY